MNLDKQLKNTPYQGHRSTLVEADAPQDLVVGTPEVIGSMVPIWGANALSVVVDFTNSSGVDLTELRAKLLLYFDSKDSDPICEPILDSDGKTLSDRELILDLPNIASVALDGIGRVLLHFNTLGADWAEVELDFEALSAGGTVTVDLATVHFLKE